MKVKDLIMQLSNCNLDDEVEIYLHSAQKTIVDNGVDLGGLDYLLIDPVIVDKDNKWDGLVTIEPGKVVGC